MSPNKCLMERKRCSVVPMYPYVIPESLASSAYTPRGLQSPTVPIPGYIPGLVSKYSHPQTQVIVQVLLFLFTAW